MKITFVLMGRGLSGGVRVVVQHANLLRARGHDVTIVSQRLAYPRKLKSLAKRLWAECRARLGLSRDHLDSFTGRLIEAPAAKLAASVPPGDVVIATYWTTAGLVRDLPAACGRKFYFLQHYEGHSSDPQAVDATWRMPLRKIVIARWLQDLARDRFDDPTAVLVPNGVDTDQFDAPPRDLHDPPCVGVMYGKLPWKGTAVAFEAFTRARARVPGLRLVTFGHHAPIPALPLPDGATFHLRPPQQEIPKIYASADIWLCASTSEGFALPPLEAMACRCPVVCTRCGGPEDFVRDGQNGFLVDVGDAAAMAERIVTLLGDRQRHQAMAAAAYATREEYTWARSADRFERALLDDSASDRPNATNARLEIPKRAAHVR